MKNIQKNMCRKVHKNFVQLGRERNRITYKLLALLPKISELKIYELEGYANVYDYAARIAGLSPGVVKKALKLEEKLQNMPHLQKVIKTQGINKVGIVVGLATKENEKDLAEKVEHMSKPALQEYSKELRGKVTVSWQVELDGKMMFMLLKLKKKFGQNLSNKECLRKILELMQGEVGRMGQVRKIAKIRKNKVKPRGQMRQTERKTKTKIEINQVGEKITPQTRDKRDEKLLKIMCTKLRLEISTTLQIQNDQSKKLSKTIPKKLKSQTQAQNFPEIPEEKVRTESKMKTKTETTENSKILGEKVRIESRTKQGEISVYAETTGNVGITNHLQKKTGIHSAQSKPKIQKVTHYISIHKKINLSEQCIHPGCHRPAEVIHHPDRFSEHHNHKNLRPLCKLHHEFAHNGISEPMQPADYKYRKHRQAALG